MSKWIEAEVMFSTAAQPTIAKLRGMFARHGLPDVCCSDNQSTFTGAEFQHFLKENGIVHITIAPRHSRGNGLAERAVKEVKLALQREEKGDKSWGYSLCQWLFRYRTTPHTATSVTPAELMVGRKLKTRLDLLYPDLNSTVLRSQNRQRRDFNKTATARRLEIGNLVFARNFGHGSQWLPGFVIAMDGPVSYVVRLCDGRTWRRHGDQLRARTEARQLPPTWPAAPTGDVERPEARPHPAPGRLPITECVAWDPGSVGQQQTPAPTSSSESGDRLSPELAAAGPGCVRNPPSRLPVASTPPAGGPDLGAPSSGIPPAAPVSPPTRDGRTAELLRRSSRVRKYPDFFQAGV